MRSLCTFALLAVSIATSSNVESREFKIVEMGASTELSFADLKPDTILFNDRFDEKLADSVSGLIKFRDWERSKPFQHRFLSLYPAYSGPSTDVTGAKKPSLDRLHMYVAEARFLLDRPAESVDVAGFVSLEFLASLDPSIKHRLIASSDAMPVQDTKFAHNQRPGRPWCESGNTTICIQSRYKFEGKLPAAIRLVNKLRDDTKRIAEHLEFQSELTVLAPDQVDWSSLPKLTGIDTTIAGGLQQNIFYINQMLQFGKLLAVVQRHPVDANKAIASVFVALAVESSVLNKKDEYANTPILRNLIPAAVIAGKSSFNTGNSISAGLPNYALNQVKAVASMLQKRERETTAESSPRAPEQ